MKIYSKGRSPGQSQNGELFTFIQSQKKKRKITLGPFGFAVFGTGNDHCPRS